MKKNLFFSLIAVFLLAGSLIVSSVSAEISQFIGLAAAPTDGEGYVGFGYGTTVKEEPTAETPQSKLWWNDGRWWGVLFDPGAELNTIYWFNSSNNEWVKTGTTLDSRPTDATDPTDVGVRFDALWDDVENKLYLASHIKQDNPSRVNSEANWAWLSRYSYSTSSKTYQLDTGYPVTVNKDKTETLVLDKDSNGRLWVTYVSRIPVAAPSPQVYKVYINHTTDPNDDTSWLDEPIALSDLTSFGPAAVVNIDDISSLIAFGNKVGVMWSNSRLGYFYFAVPANINDPDGTWSVTQLNSGVLGGTVITANDHISLVKNNADEVFAAVKSDNNVGDTPLIGVIARSTAGSFSFTQISNVASVDTRPTMVLDETNNRLYLFVSSNETGGVICVNTIQLPGKQVTGGNCSSDLNSPAPHFISSSVYSKIDNATSTKQNITNNTGLVVLASDDENGHVYLYNTLNILPPIDYDFQMYLPIIMR